VIEPRCYQQMAEVPSLAAAACCPLSSPRVKVVVALTPSAVGLLRPQRRHMPPCRGPVHRSRRQGQRGQGGAGKGKGEGKGAGTLLCLHRWTVTPPLLDAALKVARRRLYCGWRHARAAVSTDRGRIVWGEVGRWRIMWGSCRSRHRAHVDGSQ